MVIHSIVDPQEMMERQADPSSWVNVSGGMLQGIRGENGLVVTRLVSTDPAMYLDPRYAPGAIYPAQDRGSEQSV